MITFTYAEPKPASVCSTSGVRPGLKLSKFLKIRFLKLFVLLLGMTVGLNAQNIFSGEPVQVVGQMNGYSTATAANSAYRRVSVNTGTPTDGRGQWMKTYNAQSSGGDVLNSNMAGGGGNGFLFISGPSANRFQNKWVFSGVGQAALNAINNISAFNSGNDMGLNMGTAGRYTFVFNDAGYTQTNARFYVGYTLNAPVTVTNGGVTFSNNRPVISITTGNTPSSGENIYVRYRASTNDFTTGTSVVQATGSGTNWSATLPVQTCGSTVYYYVYTSTRTLTQINADSESDRFLATLRYDDNSGSNYTINVPSASTFYQDADNDGYGNPSSSVSACTVPNGYVANNSDCNDGSAALNPTTIWYKDADNDGHSDGTTLTQCAQPTNYKLAANLTATSGDCDDSNPALNPATVWYLDADNDGYYTGSGVTQCASPGTGYRRTGLTGGGDCNDNDAAINPGATEVCDGIDNNCDGNTDEGAVCPTGSISGATTVICYNDYTVKLTASASGGAGPYTYLWNTGKSGEILTGAGAGTYTCTITDQNGKTFVASHTITQPTAVTGSLVVTGVKCLDPNKGSIVVTASGGTPGYTYALNFGAWQPSNSFLMLEAGKYKVNIKDANGCQGILSAVVTQLKSSMTLSAVRVGVTRCGASTGSITATAGSGVEPYQYQLGTGSFQSSGSFTGLTAGTYSVTAKDAIGCTVTRSYTVTDNGSDAYEANNTIGAAKTINLGVTVEARIGTATDAADWFRFTTGAGTSYDINMSHPSITYTFKLFTAAGLEVLPASSGAGIKSYTGLLPNTSYRIQVTGSVSLVCYNLMVAAAAPAPTTEMLTSKAVDGQGAAGLKAQPFPNPHNGSFMLQVESPVAGKGSIVLYDVQGRTIVTREENLRAGTNQVRFSNLQPINYFYRVMVGDKATSGKVFKQ